jgi:hydrogenase-4 component B
MLLIFAFLILAACVIILPSRYKRYFSFGVSLYLAIHSSYYAYQAFTHNKIDIPIGYFGLLGDIDLKIDYLSAVFILMINFVVLASSIYSVGFLRKLTHDRMALNLHLIAFSVLHASMLLLCMFDNILAFMIFWEIMSFSSFVLLIFDYQKGSNIKAAVNYLIQMHIGAVFLMAATIIITVFQSCIGIFKHILTI